jgi:hypothetical protein
MCGVMREDQKKKESKKMRSRDDGSALFAYEAPGRSAPLLAPTTLNLVSLLIAIFFSKKMLQG